MDSAYVPDRKVRAVIVDGKINRQMEDSLASLGMDVIKTIEHPHLYKTICGHPDVVICPVGNGRLVVEPEMFDYFADRLARYSVELLRGETELSSNYPFNIAYNIATVRGKAILYPRYADPVVLRELARRNMDIIRVKQGYAKCTTAIVHHNAIITSDKGIATAAAENGVDVLLIRPGFVELEGFEYGFIGGCCGRISHNTIVFAGDPASHADWCKIERFLDKYNILPVSLYDGPLVDIGSIIPVVEIF